MRNSPTNEARQSVDSAGQRSRNRMAEQEFRPTSSAQLLLRMIANRRYSAGQRSRNRMAEQEFRPASSAQLLLRMIANRRYSAGQRSRNRMAEQEFRPTSSAQLLLRIRAATKKSRASKILTDTDRLRIGATRKADAPNGFTAGFTLIELILVMALLAVVVSFAAPTLSHFFRGRKLDYEARRFVALTRYGQNLAVSVGSPMVLWLDLVDGTYGVRDQSAYTLRDVTIASEFVKQRQGHEAIDTKQPEFKLAENLRFELVENVRTNGRIATVRFLPDGAIDEGSLRSLLILQESRKSRQSPEDAMVWITQSVNGSRYEIVNQTNVWERINSGTEIPRGFHVR